MKKLATKLPLTIPCILIILLLVLTIYEVFISDDHLKLETYNCKNFDFDCYRKCLTSRFSLYPTITYWRKFPQMIYACREAVIFHHIIDYPKLHETKYAVSPITISKEEECNIVTLGIGHDIEVEVKMKKNFPKWCRFNGADPSSTINKDLYETIGVYHAAAVGTNSSSWKSFVLNDQIYEEKRVVHVELTRFLKDFAKIDKVVDVLLIDIEGDEYEILPLLRNSGRLKQNNITICQYNIEFHWPSKVQEHQFAKYLTNTVDDGTFLPMKASTLWGVGRLYVLNVADEICIRRYLSRK